MKSFLCVWARQNYALTLADKLRLPLKEDFLMLLGLLTALSLSMNHVYTTKTLGKELEKTKNIMQRVY